MLPHSIIDKPTRLTYISKKDVTEASERPTYLRIDRSSFLERKEETTTERTDATRRSLRKNKEKVITLGNNFFACRRSKEIYWKSDSNLY